MHDWVLANEHMARELAAKGYKYQFVFARNSGHCDRTVKAQTLPNALECSWKDYQPARYSRVDRSGPGYRPRADWL